MKENKLDKFVGFLTDHLNFNIGILEHIDMPDLQSFSGEQMRQFSRKYEKTVSCGENFGELYNFRNEALQYLYDLHQHYNDTFSLLIDYSAGKIRKFRAGYYRLKIGNHSFLTHKDIKVKFNSTYEDHYSQLEGEVYNTLTNDDYLKTEKYLTEQAEVVDAVINYLDTITGKQANGVGTAQEESTPVPEKPTYMLPKKMVEEQKEAEKQIYTIKDLANLLKVSTRTIYNWKDLGILPYSQVGSKTYISAEQLKDFLKHHEVKALKLRRGF